MLLHVSLITLFNHMLSKDVLHGNCHGVHMDLEEQHGLTTPSYCTTNYPNSADPGGAVMSANASATVITPFWEFETAFTADKLHHVVRMDLQDKLGVTTSTSSTTEYPSSVGPGAAMSAKASATDLPPFWESEAAFSADELHYADQILRRAELSFGNNQSFSGVPRDASTQWLYQKMISLALKADDEAGWGLLAEASAHPADMMIYDRFGPKYSDDEFEWHCDAMDSDPARRISVVAYFTPPAEYEGGVLQINPTDIKMQGSGTPSTAQQEILHKQYGPGWAVAFPSRSLEHGVTPVTKGERRSLLLIVGLEDGSESELPEYADLYVSST
eukprot:gnl/MRDRNA2_/MRDRNA2_36001_c0_seq1.p1 gnl/MRDRNA2_/MRDRNA2_36001_c0~~gnl/MRDRNA2_/MRDRNA2_36001_c0_seq1.p1  ORF type:complete len:330 (-),score=70.53 gnl/MRDRNA2_/MRDRNA2_36001_c0_seq1:31-1020(-)